MIIQIILFSRLNVCSFYLQNIFLELEPSHDTMKGFLKILLELTDRCSKRVNMLHPSFLEQTISVSKVGEE